MIPQTSMKHFKFVGNLESVAYLLKGLVRFTPPHELNDPSELQPLFDSIQVRESLANLRTKGYSEADLASLQEQGALLMKLDPRSMAVKPPTTLGEANKLVQAPFYDQTEHLEELLTSTVQSMSGKVGVFCLTRTTDSLPMWAHYAGIARGAIVQFDGLAEEFPGDETGILHQLRDVEYFPRRPSVTFQPASHQHLFFSKLADWSYERESRVVMALSDCEQGQNNSGEKLYLYQLKQARASRVILGWNLEAAEIQDWVSKWKVICPDIEINVSTFRADTISFDSL